MKKKKYKPKQRKSPPVVTHKKNIDFQKYLPYFGLAIILLLVIIIRRNFLSIPFERDEGYYCYLGQCILDGKIPMVDFIIVYFGMHYVYAGMLWIFGNTLEQIHIGFIFINLLTVGLLFFIGRKLFSNIIALIIAASFALLSMSPHASGFTVQSEHLIIMFLCIGLLLVINAINSKYAIYFFLSGVMLGIACLVKPQGAFFTLFIGVAILSYYVIKKPINIWTGTKNSLIYSAGVLTPVIIVMLLMLAYGVLDDIFSELFGWGGSYVSKHSIENGIDLFKAVFNKVYDNYQLFWVLALSGVVLVFFVNISKYKKFVLIAFALFSFFVIVPGYRFFGHYWILTMPAVSIFIGITIMFLIQILSKFIKQRYSQILIFLVFIVLLIIHLNNNKKYYFETDNIEVLRRVYEMNPFPEAKVIGDFIKNNTNEDDKIALLGSEPQVYIYSGRRGVSKDPYFTHLMQDTTIFPEITERQQEFINGIIEEKPKYLVYFNHRNSIWASPNASFMVFTRFDEVTRKDYNLIGCADMISYFNTQYIWYDDMFTYEPEGSYYIFLYERKE